MQSELPKNKVPIRRTGSQVVRNNLITDLAVTDRHRSAWLGQIPRILPTQ